jgi:hypothetical protein
MEEFYTGHVALGVYIALVLLLSASIWFGKDYLGFGKV